MSMQGSFVRQTRSKTLATQQNAVSSGPQATCSDGANASSGEEFEPSVIDVEHGDDIDCAVCRRPNNAELYMVQCGTCKHWYHFSCANVDTATVRSRDFICVKCTPRISPTHPSSKSGRSSASSRRNQIARELQQLEEERCLREKLEDEKLQKEKFLVEKAMNEKLEREKEFLARKHELLRQQDEDAASIRSARSSRSQASSRQKVEAWFKQQQMSDSATNGSNQLAPSVKPTGPVGSSTPLEISEVNDVDPKRNQAGPILHTIDSISTGGSPGTDDDVRKQPDQQQQNPAVSNTPKLPLVNIQPFVRLLEETNPTSSKIELIPKSLNTGVLPKIVPNLRGHHVPYTVWQRETKELRKQHQQQCLDEEKELQRLEQREQELTDLLKHAEEQRELERQRMHETLQQQWQEEEKELRRREQREQELTNLLKHVKEQREQDGQRLQEIEAILKKQNNIEKQHQKREVDLVKRLKSLEQQCAVELAKRDEEKQRFLAQEQYLTKQLESLRLKCEQQPAAEQRGFPETPQQQDLPVSIDRPMDPNRRVETPHTPYVPPKLGPVQDTLGQPQFMPNIPVDLNPGRRAGSPYTLFVPPKLGPPVVDGLGQPQFIPKAPYSNPFEPTQHQPEPQGPTPHQLAARQVIARELPVFSGDPIEWPLFISSYNHSTEACGYSSSENLLRLQRSLKGVAKEAVSSFLLHPTTVPQVLSTLQTLYGRPEQIVHNLVAKVRATPAPKAERLETLIQFGLAVQNLCGHLEAVGMENHLSNPILLQELVDKLPANIKFSWALHQEGLSVVDLKGFSEYMRKVTTATSGVTNFYIGAKPTKDEKPRTTKDKAFVNAHATHERKDSRPTTNQPGDRREQTRNAVEKGGEANKNCPVCNVRDHTTASCAAFKKLSIDGRWNFVKDNKLCRRCLVSHTRWPCEGEVCGINSCPKRHHRLLHNEPDKKPPVNSTDATVTIHRYPVSSTLFKIIPVTLYGKNGLVNTYAFLDDGSSVTLVEQSIANELGVNSRAHSLCIHWTSGINKKIASKELEKLRISEPGSERCFNLSEVYTVENLGLPEQSLDFEQLAKEFKHLRHLPVKSFQRAVPGLLIGLSNSHLLTTTKLREGKEQEPIAVKTRIGWVVCGRVRGGEEKFQHRQMHICTETPERDLHDYVREFFSVESLGVAVAPHLEGNEDQRARRILEETTVRTEGGKFETGLLWKQDFVEFPESRPMAERRLRCLERRLEKDPQLYDSVRQQVADYESKGYIHVVTKEEMAEFDQRRTWYLPLGVVLNPNKPGKVRVIWDAAAKVGGVSLNTMLLKGPDLLTPQLYVTFKFREREVAFSGDIQEMFLQVGVRKNDQSALLFVYRNSSSEPMVTMASNVAIFGATCSPAQSQYVKNLNATENEQVHPKAAAAIKNKHYVDDYLDSVDTEEEAVALALEVAEVHQKAGFRIRNWVSNRSSVLEAIGEVSPAAVKDLSMNSQSGFERVLGISWLPSEDLFCFTISLQGDLGSLVESKIAPTKRMMLSFIMKIYDPLGLVGSLVIQGKILLQDVWRANVDWDDQISEDLFARWKMWLKVLKELDNVKIPRSYFPGYDPTCYDTLELHIFVDGSAQAYSAAAYFRVRDRGQIRCALVASKTKVAPLQLTSVPRLELQAAVIGARLRKTIEDGHSIQIKRTYFWSDSSTVVSWIKSDTRRYQQYVAFRVNEILSLSRTDEWRWLGTKINVADEATKWGKGPNCKSDSRWMRGPDFLCKEEDDWPMDKFTMADETQEELRPAYVCSHFLSSPMIDTSRFSKYERLLRSMAYVHRFSKKLLQRIRRGPCNVATNISSEDLQNAERSLWRMAQSDCYPDEVATLNRNARLTPENRQAISRSSSLANLSPIIDEHGLMRVDSRIAAADYVEYDAKFPIILPKGHPITNLLLDWYHRKFRHANNETIVNEIRQKFNIPQLRPQIRSIAKRCQWCRIYKATPVVPKMSPLPRFRITPFLRPFTFVGIDYFGPYLVKIGRSAVKRWVAIFTCLTVRAIHMEVVHSLTTDSCKKAVRRFIARRGAPQEVYTDNGTNFIGASRELEEELRDINRTMGSTFTDANTQWRFNPPSAPHMGGCWERMVRSVKTALGTLPVLRKMDDEAFVTMLAEAEHMVNSRPLTFLPLDSVEQESLTPNHFLMLSSSGVRQTTKAPVDDRKALKGSWELIQNTLDSFWNRWIIEYLPVITRRSKWFHDVAPIKEGTLVMLADEKLRNLWIRGRVSRTYPGKDGIVRQADVETSTRILKRRPVCKLAALDVCGRDEEDKNDRGDTNCGGRGETDSSEHGAVEPVFVRHEGEDVTKNESIDAPLEAIDVSGANV